MTVPPGFVDGNGEQPPQAPREQQEVDSIFWAKKKDGTKGKARATRALKVTSAGYTRCWKCNHLRPEVSAMFFFAIVVLAQQFLMLLNLLRGRTIVRFAIGVF